MVTLPTGTVTFLYTDIEGSTRLWEQQPDAMRAALARHDSIVRQAIESHEGAVFRTAGDAFSCAFATATPAAAAAIEMQQALHAEAWLTAAPLRVRAVLHTTQAEVVDGDYVGSGLNRVGRLLAACHGGQVLVSRATELLLRDHLSTDTGLPPGIHLRDLGRQRFRDLVRTESVFQLVVPGLPDDFPPLASSEAVPNNLPQQLTSFVGREQELAELRDLLEDRQVRLLTLIGPGGTGKTRLSLQAAGNVLDGFVDGVWLVELANVPDPRQVSQAIAAVLGIAEQMGRPLLDMLTDFLRQRSLLLILDNCEHVIDECARLADHLLRHCPELQLLASSREALGIGGEQIFRVRSLALPSDGGEVKDWRPEELARFEGIRLFVERAAAVHPGFALTSDNGPAVLQVCLRLDGIPLAIELAAARVWVLSPQQIAERLDDRFRLLTGGSRTALPRQRTLQALIDWSYDLLSEPERTLLRRVSVFSGGWTLDAAEDVCSGSGVERYQVLDLLEQLVNKSLVMTEESETGMRYRLLETIRQYAQEKLVERLEADATRKRHLAFRVQQAEEAWLAFTQLRGGPWFSRVRVEADNMRAVHAWALEHDLEAALRLVPALTERWHQATYSAENLRLAEKTLQTAEADAGYGQDGLPEHRRLLAQALAAACALAFRLGLNPAAMAYAQRSIAIAREVQDHATLSWALGMGAAVSGFLGDLETASRWQQEGLVEARLAGHRLSEAIILTSPLDMSRLREPEELEQWQLRWEEGMAMMRQAGELWGQGLGHQVAAILFMFQGRLEDARSHAEEALAFYMELGDRVFANIPRSIMADLDRAQGNYQPAFDAYQQAIRVWRDAGNMGAIARCLECLAFIYHARARELDAEPQPAVIATATRLLGAADAIRKASNSPMAALEQPEYDGERSAILALAGRDVFEAAWRQGQQISLDEAVAWATETLSLVESPETHTPQA